MSLRGVGLDMSFIPSHEELGRHPKTRRAARILAISLPQIVGHLHFLWWWGLHYAQDGDITQWENADIADAALWEGDPNEFVEALVNCGVGGGAGFIERLEDGELYLHDWDDYGGKLLEARERHAQTVKKSRDSHVTVTRQSRSRLDKIREDKIIEEKSESVPHFSAQPSGPPGDYPEPEEGEPRASAQAHTREAPKNANKSSPGKTLLPPDFCMTAEMAAWATEKGYSEAVNLAEITEEFIEYWTQGEGQREKRLNWELTWKNRVRDVAARTPKQRSTNGYGTNGTGGYKPSNKGTRNLAKVADLQRRIRELGESRQEEEEGRSLRDTFADLLSFPGSGTTG